MTTTEEVPMPEPDVYRYNHWIGGPRVEWSSIRLDHSFTLPGIIGYVQGEPHFSLPKLRAYADARCAKLQAAHDLAVQGWAEGARLAEGRLQAMQAERDALAEKVKAMEAERDEADRRAGAAERWLAREKESSIARSEWLSKAKRQAGYDDRVSFDDVWAEALAAMKVSRGAPTDCDTGVVLKPREIWALCHGSRREGNRGGVALYCGSEAEARHEAAASDYPKVAVCFREVFCLDDFKAAGDAAIDAAGGGKA